MVLEHRLERGMVQSEVREAVRVSIEDVEEHG